ncbi:hypothetical protein VOLCADRAFT_92103 [Volvox carteri f. nagariensis]|uniref:Flagellar associated protein n=1 Tax=Volvox carteri f. nagariensis TaxID=3068 RepID=D8TYL5_VOLCA|nr:uncharacterized protein VOLCADRAFT_92103 [Volvox carteri f. nagariensis]EFJ47417.1 hypothetical protein VOLCADRAFT_92103 [Volvox carteri f. nagariensis]|eukprot:XP_002951606.1 hypothetical protein VOLCADRAFT_92103 [Volvox carteri f. nagariensis]
MTNLGPRRKGSARLEPLPYGNGRTSQTGLPGEPAVALPDGRSAPSAHLPPLNRPKDTAVEAFDSVMVDDVSPGVSPARRARKAALLTRSMVDGDHRTVLQASLALDQKEREMALIRENKREYGRILLELWVNQVLDNTGASSGGAAGGGHTALGGPQGLGDPLKVDASALKGLASYGLTRVELLGAGLSNEAIDRLYRCMYVYTVGFFDVMQDILSHNEFRTEILSNVWKGFLTIAESALQVAFRSDYLKLYQSQQVAMAELLFAKEQLAEAKQDSVNTEQAVAWLTNAHAEERAARQVLKGQVAELQTSLERERQAHQAAVTKYVAEVEERVRLQAQLVSATAKLSDAAVAQADLVMQRDHLTSELEAAEERATRILDHVRGVYDALTLEKALRPNTQLVNSLASLLQGAANTAAGIVPAISVATAAPPPPLSSSPADAAMQQQQPSAEASGVSVSSNPAQRGSKAGSLSLMPSAQSSTRASAATLPPAAEASAVSLRAATRKSLTGGSNDAGGAEGSDPAAAVAAAASSSAVDVMALPPVLPPLDAPARAEATVLYANLIGDLSRQLYGMWRDQTEATANTARALYDVRDTLRATKVKEHELQVDLDKTRATVAQLQTSLAEVGTELRTVQGNWRDTEEALTRLKRAKEAVDQQADELSRTLEITRTDLASTQVERNTLLAKAITMQHDLEVRDVRLERLERELAVARNSLAEVSRAMVVYAKAAAAQDAARGYCKRQFLDATKRAGDLQWSLFRMERQVRTLEGKIEHKSNEMAALAAASDSAKNAAEQVQNSLTAALLDIENKKAMIGSLDRALSAAKEECDKVKQELENAMRRAEDAEIQLESSSSNLATF